MELTKYILSVAAAGIVCGLITTMAGSGAPAAVIKMLAGIFLAVALIRPLTGWELADLEDYWDDLNISGAGLAEAGKIDAQEETAAIIKERAQAYILDKADSLHAEVTAEVSVEPGDIPTLTGVCIRGRISPYGKNRLSQFISEDLGIAKENQTWIG